MLPFDQEVLVLHLFLGDHPSLKEVLQTQCYHYSQIPVDLCVQQTLSGMEYLVCHVNRFSRIPLKLIPFGIAMQQMKSRKIMAVQLILLRVVGGDW